MGMHNGFRKEKSMLHLLYFKLVQPLHGLRSWLRFCSQL